MLTLTELKGYLRLEQDEEDSFLSSLLLTSDSFIKNATHSNADNSTDIFKLAQMILVAHWYENRQAVGKSDTLAFSLDNLLMQITYTTDDAT